jgi:hypothetical protein
MFIRDRPFDHEDEIVDLPFRGLVEGLHKVAAIGQG